MPGLLCVSTVPPRSLEIMVIYQERHSEYLCSSPHSGNVLHARILNNNVEKDKAPYASSSLRIKLQSKLYMDTFVTDLYTHKLYTDQERGSSKILPVLLTESVLTTAHYTFD